MSLLDRLLPKKEVKQYFLTLGVNEHRITAAVALLSENQVTIVGTGESEFTSGENETEAADIAVSFAEKNLPPSFLVEKVVFGLPTAFIEDEKIKPEYLARLEKITKELSLTSYGFVEYPQALAFYLEGKEESPPTLLLLSVGRNYLTFSHIRVGKVERNIIVDRSSSFVSDFEEGLKQFTSEILPSRVILYDEAESSEMEEIREELLRFPWHKHTSFLHTPKIEILPSGEIITALVEAGATSIIKELHPVEEKRLEEKKVAEEKKEQEQEETFGFIKGEDIGLKEISKKEKVPSEKSTPVVRGFSLLNLQRFSFSLPVFPLKQLPLLALGGTTILLLSFFFLFFWFYPQATVNLIVYPLASTQQIEVIFTTDTTRSYPGKNIILAKTTSSETSGEKTIPTSGKKKVGEQARGEVVIYNKTTTGKTFPKSTIFTSDSLRFTLDEEVSVASASETGEGLTFGKTSTKITASDIGPEGNLPAGSNFAFKDFPLSSYSGKNLQNLTGGTSREVSSVAKEDQNQVLASLTEELVMTAKQQLQQKLNFGEKLLEGSTEKVVSDKKFSKEAGIEAKEISLSLSLKLNALVFKESDLTTITPENLASLPSGFLLDNKKTQVRIGETKTDKKGDILATATITSYFLPKIDEGKIKSNLTGKSFKIAADFLSQEKHIGGVEIIKEQGFPFFGDRLPWRTQNIFLRVVTW